MLNEQMAHELALNGSDVQQITAQLREGIVKNGCLVNSIFIGRGAPGEHESSVE